MELSPIWVKNRGSLVVTYKWNPGTGEAIGKNTSVVTRSWISPCIDDENK